MNKDVIKLIAEIRELYRAKASVLEVTKAEFQLWELVKWDLKPPTPRSRDWFRENVEIVGDAVTYPGLEVRLSLLSANAVVLLDAIDDTLSVYTARNIFVQAKARRRLYRTPIDEAIAVSLAEYRKTGKVVEIVAKPDDAAVGTNVDVSSTKSFYTAVKKLALEYIEQRLPSADMGERNEAIEDFTEDLRASFDELIRRVTKYSRDALRRERISIGEVDEACEILGILRQKGSEDIDMEWARRQHRKLSAQLHPDRDARNADPRIVEQYTAIQEAWDLLQDYERQQHKSAKGRAGHKDKS